MGGLWVNEDIAADQPSEPFLVNGFESGWLHLSHQTNDPVSFMLEGDSGNGSWESLISVTVDERGYLPVQLYGNEGILEGKNVQWMRVRPVGDALGVSTYFRFGASAFERDDQLIAGLSSPSSNGLRSEGIVRPGKDQDLTLQFAADLVDNEDVTESSYYEIGEDFILRRVQHTKNEHYVRTVFAPSIDFTVDAASVIMTDAGGRVFRLPRGDKAFDKPSASGTRRGIREVVTERSLMNIHGTFYELPRNDSGGIRGIQPMCTHNLAIHDFASWRGMLVLTGVDIDNAQNDAHIIHSEDKKAALWLGNVDDLRRFGRPQGVGGPWHETQVKAGSASDPYLMAGYDQKEIALQHHSYKEIKVTIEVDVRADGEWVIYDTIMVPAGETVHYHFPNGYSAHWLRLITNTDCVVTAQLTYY